MAIKIALAGNPNCGKTTLFNALTGSSQYVGNCERMSDIGFATATFLSVVGLFGVEVGALNPANLALVQIG